MKLHAGTVVGHALACLLVLGLSAVAVHAAVPATMNYQGHLTDSEGVPRNGVFAMTFAIYADSIGGSALWSEARAEIPVNDGLFSLLLGAGTGLPAAVFSGATLWLETAVSDTVLAPRRPLVAVPYSFRALVADSAAHAPAAAGDSLWTASGGDVYRLGGNVGLGTATPAGKLDVTGTVQLTGFKLPTGATSGYVLTSDASGVGTWAAPVGQGAIGGGGTVNNVARFTAFNAIGNSMIWDGGSSIGIGTQSPGGLLHLRGFNPSSRVLLVQGTGGQAVNLQEWADYSGAVLASVGPGGVFAGNGSGLTGLNAGSLSGTVPSAVLSGTYSGSLYFPNATATGTFNGSFSGNGSGLTSLNASNLTSGTVPGGALSGGYPSPVNFSSSSNVFTGSFTGNGAGLNFLNASNLTSGTLPSSALNGSYNSGLVLTNPGNTYYGSGYYLTNLNASYISNGTLASSRLPTGGSWTLSSNLDVGAGVLYVDRANRRIGIGTSSPSKLLTLAVGDDYDITTLGGSNLDITTAAGSSAGITISAQEQSSAGITLTAGNWVGIGTSPSTILTILQNSSSDPIADSWGTYSSRRWKERIVPIQGALGLVQRLQGVRYVLKANGRPDIGMIAEDVGQVLPEVVQFEDNGVDAKGIDYARLTAVLVEAVKQLKAENEALSRRVEDLERAGR